MLHVWSDYMARPHWAVYKCHGSVEFASTTFTTSSILEWLEATVYLNATNAMTQVNTGLEVKYMKLLYAA
jgi:hypothetical protein